ncbi:MAG: hypothetical protein ACE5FQ_06425 [Thiogranum sp.]
MLKVTGFFRVFSFWAVMAMIFGTAPVSAESHRLQNNQASARSGVDATGQSTQSAQRGTSRKRPSGGRPGNRPPSTPPPVEPPPVEPPPAEPPPADGKPVSAKDFFGHNQERAGNTGRQDWGGSTDIVRILDQLALGKDMVVDFLPEKAGCGYIECAKGEDSLELYLDAMTATGRSAVHEAGLVSALDTLSGNLDSVWLQAGNEVYSSLRKDRWEAYFGTMSNQEWIANYVEYFWAPFAAIVSNYEAQHGVDVKLMLGSVQNVSGRENRQMLLDTWNYVIQGWVSPELAGMRVGDLYECASGHYLLSNDSNYLTDLGELFDQTGCFWATEEIGRRRSDKGVAYDEMNKVMGRALQTAIERGLTPDQFRVLPWETSEDAAQANIDFENISQGATIIGINGDGETFQIFLSDGRVIDL